MKRLNLDTLSYWRDALDLGEVAVAVSAYGDGALPVIDGADAVDAAAWRPSQTAQLYHLDWHLDAFAPDDCHVGVWCAGARLVEVQTLEELSSQEGFYMERLAQHTIRVHLRAPQDPGALPSGTYEISRRQIGLRVAHPASTRLAGASVNGIWTRRVAGCGTSLTVGASSTLRRALAEEGYHHTIVVGSGQVEDVTAWGCYADTQRGRATLVSLDPPNGTNEHIRLIRCRARSTTQEAIVGFGPTSPAMAPYAHLQYEGVTVEYCETGLALHAHHAVIQREGRRYSYATGCSESVHDACSFPHTVAIDGLLIRGVSDSSSLSRPNRTALAFEGNADTITVRNTAIVLDSGQSIACGPSVSRLVLDHCVLYHTGAQATLNLGLHAAQVNMHRCIVIGASTLLAFSPQTVYTGDHNVFVPGEEGFRIDAGGTQYTDFSAWQQATAQDTSSLLLDRSALSTVFQGDVLSGDFRLAFEDAGMTARQLEAGLEHEIAAWPSHTATPAEEAQRLVPELPPSPPPVALLTPHRITRPTERLRYTAADLEGSFAMRLRWLAAEVLSGYPDATTDLDVARCLRDWIARTAVHPYSLFHSHIPAGQGNETLPPGVERVDLTFLDKDNDRIQQDSAYWAAYNHNGYGMLCALLGLDAATGVYTGEGFMVRVAPGYWRIRDVATFPFVLCSYQQSMLQMLLAAAGLHGMLITTYGHDPGATWVPSLGKWIMNDPTYNDTYLLDGTGAPLSPVELLNATTTGALHRLQVSKILTASGRVAPTWADGVYIDPTAPGCTYLSDSHPSGFVIMGAQLNNSDRWSEAQVGGAIRLCLIDGSARHRIVPFGDEITYAPCAPYEAFPYLGCAVVNLEVLPTDEISVHLETAQPHAQGYEVSIDGAMWIHCPQVHTVAAGSGLVQYRSVDHGGRPSSTASISM